jgi:hypothetical protein
VKPDLVSSSFYATANAVPNGPGKRRSGDRSATAGTGVISYTGGSVAAGSACTIAVAVTGGSIGTFANVTGDLTSSLGSSGTATDSLVVLAPRTAIPTMGLPGLLLLFVLLVVAAVWRHHARAVRSPRR